ncbi:MAG: phosphoribosyltransferase domain-containing protein [Gammaproteobacteria bacterium]
MKYLEVTLPTGRLSLELAPGRIPLRRLIGFAARQNPKRPFLFVSKLLGKHYPVRPAAMTWSYRKLAAEIQARGIAPGALWIGMAETATGLGYGVFEAAFAAAKPALYLQTTRYRLDGHGFLTFEESHSHASDFWLYYPAGEYMRRRFAAARELVLIDDEISTGNTFARLVQAYRRVNPALQRVFVVSLVNFADAAARQQVAARCGLPVEWVALRHGRLVFAEDERFVMPPMPHVVAAENRCKKALLHWPGRLGLHRPVDFAQRDIETLLSRLKAAGPVPKPVLVAGTGECIAPAYLLGRALERCGFDIRVQSTTRSPILLGGAIRTVMRMVDNYGDGIENFLYNVQPDAYRDIVICHETPLNDALLAWLPDLKALSVRVAAQPETNDYATLSVRRFG